VQFRSSKPALTPEKGALLLMVFGALGLLAVPGGKLDPGPRGAVEGIVMAPHKADRVDVPVLLFADDGTTPAELTHTDASGRFAFQQSFEHFRVLALPSRDSGFAPSWRIDLEPGVHDFISLSLVPAEPLVVAVVDAQGFPVPGAEIAVYTLGPSGPVAADVAVTNPAGQATVLAPEQAGLSARRAGFEPVYEPAPLEGPAHLTLTPLP
jgi:hypothetical protein